MPDKTLKVVTYAAGASLAAITLIYVFAPTYFLDNHDPNSVSGAFSGRKKGAVGLSNTANDCFINSVLQALAGLGDLRLYLIREVHRRNLDEQSIYTQIVPADVRAQVESDHALPPLLKDTPEWKLQGLQTGSVTKGLKGILDALNERPINRKTISAAPFLRVLEQSFRQRISRQQQDAQEFLQVVAERLCDEYHAGHRARLLATCRERGLGDDAPFNPPKTPNNTVAAESPRPSSNDHGQIAGVVLGGAGHGGASAEKPNTEEQEEGFPLEGKFESQIECLTCGFKPRPTVSPFCTLTLNVPQVASSTLGACFDSMFKTEYIDDFKCEKCRLLHALAIFERQTRSASATDRSRAEEAVTKLQLAIAVDPEKPPEGIELPDPHSVPRCRIARHTRMTEFPKILAVHLSRSIFDASHSSLKNSARVVFPEKLPLGGLLQQRKYTLLGVVTHKGSHNSGHYESFRRQNMYPPFSNPSTFQESPAYSRRPSPAPTPGRRSQSPLLSDPSSSPAQGPTDQVTNLSPLSPALSRRLLGTTTISADSSPSMGASPRSSSSGPAPSASLDAIQISPASGGKNQHPLTPPTQPTISTSGVKAKAKARQQKQQRSRWWRISDDKIKEATTRDVLGMQREVYLLFYEIIRS
ncbi:uncharacterized protein C8A04DRAFT_27549 [Dichotomopilus funicola]|uniref:Ubiquitin carboxyl-terminal hydrolase n=1 Tax=Dichotomopilus funicola TaxID=1934379 RepID=A0AAN6V4I8_9PEZI|nr:hypothetical protein C8A04DRAFT_27549 [Dichotomopilus funicola]